MAQQCKPKQQPDNVLEYIASKYYIGTDGLVLNLFARPVGSIGSDGYYRITVYPNGHKRPITLRRSHVVWFLTTGEWPEDEIDHGNRIKTDDGFDNLVMSNRSLQQGNRSTSDRDLPVGVYFRPRMKTNPYQAQIDKDGKRHYLGFYSTPEKASEAYQAAQKELY